MKFLKLWMPVILWCGLIFWLSSMQNLAIVEGPFDFILRKIAHITEYFILTLLLFRAFRKSYRIGFNAVLAWSALLSLMYAVSDEYHQTFVPTRSGEISDVLIDSVGVIIAVILYIRKGNK